MPRVYAEIAHFQSPLIEQLQTEEGVLRLPHTHFHLATSFGFCDGVRRAIEIAYATCLTYPARRIWLIGEIIHNPGVNACLDAMGLRRLPTQLDPESYRELQSSDIVIIPAFGVTMELRRFLDEKGVDIVDATCGNVIKVWMHVRAYARKGITSVIHGKFRHEESIATASHSLGDNGQGRYIVVFNEADAHLLADFISGRTGKQEILKHFAGCCSQGFDPEQDLQEIGMANQTTMLKGETESIQQILKEAILERDGETTRFHAISTICGATQDRQNALFSLLEKPLDTLFIVGGYNSSNTTHLAQLATQQKPTYFVNDATCLQDLHHVRAFDLKLKQETLMSLPAEAADLARAWQVGITAGASCPASVIGHVIRRLASLRGDHLN